MNADEKLDVLTERTHHIASLSDKLFGSPPELDVAEAKDLLRTADIDPEQVKSRFHTRFDGLARQYAARGQRVPPLLKRALSDLRPGVSQTGAERELIRQAQTSIRLFLKQAKQFAQLPKLPSLALTTAFRHRKELSETDRKLLDEVSATLERRIIAKAKKRKP
jgi:hypothetical protein